MNSSIIRFVLGYVLKVEAVLMLLPCIVAVLYQERTGFAYLLVAAIAMTLGTLMTIRRPKNHVFYLKEGCVATALSWIFLSFFGALPFWISGEIPSLIDALFCLLYTSVEDAFRYGKLILATTTYNGDIFPFMKEFINHLTERSYQNRKIGFVENGSWAPMAAKIMKAAFEKSKNITFADTTVTVRSAVNEESEAQIAALAKEMK